MTLEFSQIPQQPVLVEDNIMTMTDSYKPGHWLLYVDGTRNVYSYGEFRVGAEHAAVVFLGLQANLLRFFVGQVVTHEKVDMAKRLIDANMGPGIFNEAGWRYIVDNHGGRLPLRICARPEGSVNNPGDVLFTIEATDEKCAWLTNYVESAISHVWYPSTVATVSRTVKQYFRDAFVLTGGPLDALDFHLHDFGYRGVSSDESGQIGGMAHLAIMKGTDTLRGMEYALAYYAAELDALGFSVLASEHSVNTSLGRAGELQMIEQAVDVAGDEKIVSNVADSFNIYNFVSYYVCEILGDRIIERGKKGGKFVVRPDSPTPTHPDPGDQMVWIYQTLWSRFRGTLTTGTDGKQYKLLDPCVGVLWGDGIGPDGILNIMNKLIEAGFVPNFVAGMGGGLLQKVNRDTERFAVKCSAQLRDGVWHDVVKDPLDSTKKSKAGRFDYLNLPVVFEDGELKVFYTFDEVRENAAL